MISETPNIHELQSQEKQSAEEGEQKNSLKKIMVNNFLNLHTHTHTHTHTHIHTYPRSSTKPQAE